MIETESSRKAWEQEHEEAKKKLRNLKLPGSQQPSFEPQVKPEKKKKPKGYSKK